MFDGTSWSTPREITTSAELDLISCPGGRSCLAIAEDTYLVGQTPHEDGPYTITVNGNTWGTPAKSPKAPLEAMSCATSRFCVGVIGGVAFTYR